MISFLAKLCIGLLLPQLGLAQDPGLIPIGKVKPFNIVTQPKLHRLGNATFFIVFSDFGEISTNCVGVLVDL